MDAEQPRAVPASHTLTGFDRVGFAHAVSGVLRGQGLTYKAAAREIGLAPATLHRIVHEKHMPDTQNLSLIADWARLSLDPFVIRTRSLVSDDEEMSAVLAALETLRVFVLRKNGTQPLGDFVYMKMKVSKGS